MKYFGENDVDFILSFKGGDLPSARLISAHAHRDDGFHDHAITILLVFITDVDHNRHPLENHQLSINAVITIMLLFIRRKSP